MPNPAKPAGLKFRAASGRKKAFWSIRDCGREISTGTADRNAAEIALAKYIDLKNVDNAPQDADTMTISEVLTIYGREHAPTTAAPERIGYAISALLGFWADLPVSAVKGGTCRRYVNQRGVADGTARRELGTLSAALKFCEREGYLLTSPPVTLPPKPATNQRALTRPEAARLLRAARSRGQHHIARFILIGLYTGTRKDAILHLRLSGPSQDGGWFDIGKGVMFRRGQDARITNKRQTPARLPRQLWAHARRWQAMGLTWATEWRGKPVADIKTAWRAIATDAALGWHPTPHTLKHTAITWAIGNGATIADAAGFFGTSAQTLERTYWHHSPDFQSGAVRAMERHQKGT
jgi:integrase